MAESEVQDALVHFRDSWATGIVDETGRYRLREMRSRHVKEDLEDSLFGSTLRNDSTIRHCLSLWRPPADGGDLGETIVLVSLGDGLNGHSRIVHGGFSAMLVDETCGLANMNHDDRHTFTANLSVDYRKPIPAPGVVLCRSWIKKVEGRKRYVRCTLEGPSGVLYVDANALFLEFKPGFKL